MHITLIKGDRDSLGIRPVDATVEELTELLSKFEALPNKEHGLAFMPARFRPCPEAACANKGKVDCGGGVLHRLNVNVVAMTGVGVDLDDVPKERFFELLRSFIERGLSFWVWNTHSHRPNQPTVRARLFFPFVREMPIAHPSQWTRGAWPSLMKWLGVDRLVSMDEKCKDTARLYFLPAHPPDIEGHEADYHAGEPIDWEPIVASAVSTVVVPEVLPEDFSTVQETDNPVDLEDLKKRLRAMRTPGWVPLIRNVLAGRAPVEPPDARDPNAPKRENAWFDVTMALAMAREDHENKRACLEVLKDAYLDGAKHEGFTTWEKIQDQFERACEKARVGKAERRAKDRAEAEMWLMQRDQAAQHMAEPTEEPEGGPPKWVDRLLYVQGKNGRQTLRNCTANAETILGDSEAWRGVFRFNKVINRIEIHGGPLLPEGIVRTVENDTAAKVSNWLQRQSEEFALFLDDGQVFSRIYSVAMSNAYDPLQDYLNGLEWAGVPRLDTAAMDLFNAEVTPANAEYARLVVRRFFISAAARGLEPGCKVDTVLILEGQQGARKTSAFSELAGEFFTDQYIDTQNKDSLMLIAQSWIAELGELETLRRAQVESIKQFLSQRRDQFRVPYGRGVQAFPRRCVFVGTTNRDDYLRDETGNRRYWPLKCGPINLANIRAIRDQLWAEAVHIYKSGGKDRCTACEQSNETRCEEHRWWFSAEESHLADAETEKRETHDPLGERILTQYLSKVPDMRPAKSTISEIMAALGLEHGRSHEMKLASVLKRLGFRKERLMANGIRRVYWHTPEAILHAPQETSGGLRAATPTQTTAKA